MGLVISFLKEINLSLELIVLVLVNIFSIVGLWIRLEGRLSRLEGRFDQFTSTIRQWDGVDRRQH